MGKELNLELIAKECGVPNASDTQTVIFNIQALDEVYEPENLDKIYNYLYIFNVHTTPTKFYVFFKKHLIFI